MIFSNFNNSNNLASLLVWSYCDLLQKLSPTYCVDVKSEGVLRSTNSWTPSSQKAEVMPTTVEESRNELRAKHENDSQFDWSSKGSAFNKYQIEDSNPSYSEEESISENSEESWSIASLPKRRKRKVKELDIREDLQTLRSRIISQDATEFSSSSKKAKSGNKKCLKRRSKYIGVSKNNSNWQALINLGKVKKYIGTFSSQMQAARAYDIYSVALRGEEGALNFDYTAEEMLERIEYFLKHKCIKFDS
ncbi:unnamed protein product [Moneuplotes crassus]|uniref:AP2/ERF domain-containing protein n=1 Tax=Euplotes crassus TaxID=5936 RepID=A0AAD1X604_EUPCR|nr:unnamed protein product [Moneuplotes crassus]